MNYFHYIFFRDHSGYNRDKKPKSCSSRFLVRERGKINQNQLKDNISSFIVFPEDQVEVERWWATNEMWLKKDGEGGLRCLKCLLFIHRKVLFLGCARMDSLFPFNQSFGGTKLRKIT